MTMNLFIAIENTVIALSVLTAGAYLLWQGWSVSRDLRMSWWPVSALIALGGAFSGLGLYVLHTVGWRLVDIPGHWLDQNGIGTALLRGIIAVVTIALMRRVVRRKILTHADRKRVATYDASRTS